MARASEGMHITGIDMHACSPAPETIRVQRIALTLSELPPADWQTIVARECGLARQTLWPAARIVGSCLLLECAPDDLAQHHLGVLKADVKHTKKQCGLLMAQREEETTRQLQAEQTARQRLHDVQQRLQGDETQHWTVQGDAASWR